MRIYKFLDKKWALEALRQRRLKIALLKELNDPFELFPFKVSRRGESFAMAATLADMARKYGLVCFSGSWSNPVIWAHYAEQHRGICLGFDVPDQLTRRVTYIAERLLFPDLLNLDEAARFEAAEPFLFTKFAHWQYEDEVRTSVSLDTETNGMYFVDFGENLQLKEVILGLRSQTCPREIQQALSGAEPLPEILRAVSSRDGFSMVPDSLRPRNHDELVYYLKRGGVRHPVQFVR